MQDNEVKVIGKMSDVLFARAQHLGVRLHANDNLHDLYRNVEEQDVHMQEVEAAVANLLRALVIDVGSDHNTENTAKRVAKMFIKETMGGRYSPMPAVTYFPNAENLDQLYLVGPIGINSMCSHHLMPFVGSVYIGVLPTERVIGLSKFNRITQHLANRPQIQEELTVQLGDLIEKLIEPKGLAIVVKARHLCCSARGVKDADTEMVTSLMRGMFLESPSLRSEFFSLVGNKK
jgi:GTP cyclohydrolase I